MPRGTPNPRHWALPARLRRARRAAGLSCLGLSRRAGLGNCTTLAVEAERRLPRLPVLAKLAAALRMSPGELAYGLPTPLEPGPDLAGLARRLRDTRLRQGLTVQAVADAAQLLEGTIRAIEQRGSMPTLDTLEQIAVALDVSPAWLAFGQGPLLVPDGRRRPRTARPGEERPAQAGD